MQKALDVELGEAVNHQAGVQEKLLPELAPPEGIPRVMHLHAVNELWKDFLVSHDAV